MNASSSARCPCGGTSYATCCGPLHDGTKNAAKAAQVMRARYSAFAKQNGAYLQRTWHPETRPTRIRFEADLHWVRLEVLGTTGGDLLDTEGAVEFDAHHERRGVRGVLHERSLFVRHDSAWVYVGPVAAHVV